MALLDPMDAEAHQVAVPATDENISPTSFCFSPIDTSGKPKWMVRDLSVDSFMA